MTDLATTIPAGIDTALPAQVAPVLGITPAGLAQMRYKGNGPKFIKSGHRVLYRWSDIRDYLDANTLQRTDDRRGLPLPRSVPKSPPPKGPPKTRNSLPQPDPARH